MSRVAHEVSQTAGVAKTVRVFFTKEHLIEMPFNLQNATSTGVNFEIMISHFKGFGLRKAANMIRTDTSNPYVSLSFLAGNFDIYDDENRLLGASCSDYLRAYSGLNASEYEQANKTNLLLNYVGLFTSPLLNLILYQKVRFGRHQLCPLVFQGAFIRTLQIITLQRNLLFDHVLEFSSLDVVTNESFVTEKFDLNCDIYTLTISQIYRIEIGPALVNKDVFKRTRVVYLNGFGLTIDSATFKSLDSLKSFYLSVLDMRNFYHSSDNKWLSALNTHVDFDPDRWRVDEDEMYNSSLLLWLTDQSYEYDYIDEDFCLFKHLSHRRLVLVMVALYAKLSKQGRVSCTLLYLVQYAFVERHHQVDSDPYYEEGFRNVVFEPDEAAPAVEKCNFSLRLDVCRDQTVSARSQPPNIYDTVQGVEWLEFIGPVITFPLVSIFGFVCNLFIALVLRNASNRAEFFKDERLFQFMLWNSVFNMIECVISIFQLVSECIGADSLFCSCIMIDVETQYFKIYFVQYVGECMKTSSILTVLALSHERYAQTSNSTKPIKIKMRTFLLLILVISFLTSACKLFEYSSVYDLGQFSGYNLGIEYPLNFILFRRQTIWFVVIYSLHYVLNDFVLLAINFYYDFRLLIIIRKDLKIKRQNLLNLSTSNAAEQKKLDKINQAERNTNKMVVYSFVVYLFCRFPELLVYMHLLFIENRANEGYDYFTWCATTLCNLLFNLIQYMYMFSYTTNLYFFFKFNRPFRDGFKSLFKMKIKK